MGWVWALLGLNSASGKSYLAWSGFVGDIALLGAAWALVRKHNCHEPRCWRVGRFPVEGTAFQACRRHHPKPPQRGDIRKRYHLYIGKNPGRG